MSNNDPPQRSVSRQNRPKWKKDIADLEEMVCDVVGIGAIWKFLKKNIRVMKRHWLLFGVLVALSGAGGYWIAPSSHVNATPAPVVIQALYDEKEWPPLTDGQIEAWATALAPYHIPMLAVYWGQDVEARRFFQSLQKVGNRAGFPVEAGSGRAGGKNIEIEASRKDEFGPALATLFENTFKVSPTLTHQREQYETYTQVYLYLPVKQ